METVPLMTVVAAATQPLRQKEESVPGHTSVQTAVVWGFLLLTPEPNPSACRGLRSSKSRKEDRQKRFMFSI